MNRSVPIVILVMLASIKDAHAYFDPGTGSIILQAVIAGIAAASIGLRAFWSQLKGFFYRSRTNRKADPAIEPDKRD